MSDHSFNPVGWFELYVKDMDRAKRFYESVFQTTLEKIDLPGIDMWSFPYTNQVKGISGALVHVPGYDPEGNSSVLYFTCTDCAETGSRVEPAGGKKLREKMAVADFGFVVHAEDTEGNLIGLHSRQ